MDSRPLMLLATAVGCAVLLPMLRDRLWLYWGSLGTFALATILISIINSSRPYLQGNSGVNLVAFLLVMPAVLTYALCALPVFKGRRIAVAVCAPLFYALGVVVAMNIGMQIGVIQH